LPVSRVTINHHHKTRDIHPSRDALLVHGDHLSTTRASTDIGDRHLNKLLNTLEVVLGLSGELVEAGDLGDVAVPARHGLVHDLHLGELVQHRGHVAIREANTIDLVVGTNLDFLEGGENVELGDVDGSVAVDEVGVAEDGDIKPAATTRTTSGGTELVTDLAESSTDLIVELGGEGAAADTGGVGLDDTDHRAELGGSKTEAGRDTTSGGGGGGDVRVGTEVKIEQASVGTLSEDGLAVVVGVVQEGHGVLDPGRHDSSPLLELLLLSLDIVVETVHALHGLDKSGVAGNEVVPITNKLADADTVTLSLGRVGRSDTTTSGTNSVGLGSGFELTIDELVEVEDDMRSIGDNKTTLSGDVSIPEVFQLSHHLTDIEDDAVTDDVELTRIEHAAGKEMEGELLTVNNESVTSIGTTVESGNDIVASRKDINEFTLTLITRKENMREMKMTIIWTRSTFTDKEKEDIPPLSTKDSRQTRMLRMKVTLGGEGTHTRSDLRGRTLERTQHELRRKHCRRDRKQISYHIKLRQTC